MTAVMEWPAPLLPFTELQHWAVAAQERGIQCPHRLTCMPLTLFPDSHLAEIRYDVEQDWKPPFWYDLLHAQVPSRAWYEWHWQRGVDPDAKRPPIPRFVRERVLERDGLTCQLCLGPVDPDDVHLDHIQPWSKGGEHTEANLQVTHSLCNMKKGARV